MQMQSSQGLTLADIPMGFFPEESSPAAEPPRCPPDHATFADAGPAKAVEPAQSRALKIARAITGESELRLLAEREGEKIRFVVATSTLAPYKVEREVLVKSGKKKTPLNELQALEEFERRVALAYPPETLRNNKIVAIHLNLI